MFQDVVEVRSRHKCRSGGEGGDELTSAHDLGRTEHVDTVRILDDPNAQLA